MSADETTAATPLNLDAIEARARDLSAVAFAHRDTLALVAEVRTLRAREESAIQSMPLGDLALDAVVARAEKAEAEVRRLRADLRAALGEP